MKIQYIVLYSKHLQETYNFFKSFGFELIKEQHGKSPIHYSLKLEKFILEIYPSKKENSTEYILGLEMNQFSFEIIKICEDKKYFYEEFNDFVLVHDEFGNKLHLYFFSK